MSPPARSPSSPAEQALGRSLCQALPGSPQRGVLATEGRRKKDRQEACPPWGCYQKSVKIKLFFIWQQGPAAISLRKKRGTGRGGSNRAADEQRIGLGPVLLWW